MAKKCIVINGMSFTSIKKVEDFVRSRLELNAPKGEISFYDADWNFLCALIERHPQYPLKKGPGITKFLIKRSFKGHVELHLLRADGTQVDISWKTCASGKGNTSLQNLKEAMRVSIEPQIDDFRNLNFEIGMYCQICGLNILSIHDSQIDHEIHFETLVNNFLLVNTIKVPDDFDDEIITNRAKFKIEDSIFSDDWIKFHSSEAKLRVVHSSCNLGRKKAPK